MPLFFVFVVLLMPTIGSAQNSKAPSGGPEKIKQNLLQIERDIGRANFRCDYKYFDLIEAEEFVFTDSNGGVTNKKEDMAGEKDCRKNDFTHDLDDWTNDHLHPR